MTPIRGGWTIGPGGYFEGDPNDPSYVGWHVNGPALHEPVEVVPVPDEQAIERAVDALMADSGLPQFGPHRVAVERRFRLGLAAALEQPE